MDHLMDFNTSLWGLYSEGPCPTMSRGPKGGPREIHRRALEVRGLSVDPTGTLIQPASGVQGCGACMATQEPRSQEIKPNLVQTDIM